MAKFYIGKNTLKNKVDNLENQIRLLARIAAIAILLFYIFKKLFPRIDLISASLGLSIIALIFITAFKIQAKNNEYATYKAGLDGEEEAQIIVKSLNNQFSAIPNANITFECRSSEADLIVVGPSGVFIIETKNYSGQVFGTTSAEQWVRRKISNNGVAYDENIYNPVKQVGTHTYRLAGILRQNGLNVYVKNAVLFANMNISVSVHNDNNCPTPVYYGLEGGLTLSKWLETYDENKCLSQDTINKIVKVICNNVKNTQEIRKK